MKSAEELFRNSIKQYQQLIDKATELNEQMANMPPEEILQNCEQLHELQRKQIVVDKFIIEIMQDTGPTILDMPYVGEYQRMLDKTMKSCDKVASKAKTIRTLLYSEIQKLKKGQKGLAGYTAVNQITKTKMHGRF